MAANDNDLDHPYGHEEIYQGTREKSMDSSHGGCTYTMRDMGKAIITGIP